MQLAPAHVIHYGDTFPNSTYIFKRSNFIFSPYCLTVC